MKGYQTQGYAKQLQNPTRKAGPQDQKRLQQQDP